MERSLRLLVLINISMFCNIPVAKAEVPFAFHAPFPYGETYDGGGGGSYYNQGYHVGSSQYCIDFNQGSGSDDENNPVVVIADGTVVADQDSDHEGYHTYYPDDIAILHEDGYYSLYMHLNSNIVTVGQEVHQGETIGYIGGQTGYSPHLHFCIYNSSGQSIMPTPMDGTVYDANGAGRDVTSQNQEISDAAYTAITTKADELWAGNLIEYETANMHWYGGVDHSFIIEDWDGGSWGWVALTYDPNTNSSTRAYVLRHGFWETYRNLDGPDLFGAPLGDEMDTSRTEYTPHDSDCGTNKTDCITRYCGPTSQFSSMQRFEHATLCWYYGQACLSSAGDAGGNDLPYCYELTDNATHGEPTRNPSAMTDPYPDLLVYYPTIGGWWLAKNTGLSATYYANLFQGMYTQGATEGWYIPLIENLDGDTYDDLLVYHQSGEWSGILDDNGTLPVNMQSIVTGFGGSTQYYYPYKGDFNGDGMDDALVYGSSGDYYVRLSDGSTFTWSAQDWMSGCSCGAQSLPETSYMILVSDITGDGMDDLTLYDVSNGVWYGAPSNGVNNFGLSTWLSGLGTQAIGEGYYHPVTGDINGDGLSDIGVASNTGGWYLALSTGSSFQTQTTWYDTGLGSATSQFFLKDMNGDGKADAVTFTPSTGTWMVAYSTGSFFAWPPTTLITNFGTDSSGGYGVQGYIGYFVQ